MKTFYKIFILSVIIILLSLNFTKSQSLSDIINNPDLNFFEIQDQINSNKAVLDSADEALQKRYNRWLAFWDTRVDGTGDFATYGDEIFNYGQNYVPQSNNENIWGNLGPTFETLTHKDYIYNWIYKHIGWVESIWVNPSDTSEILIGTHHAGLWKSNNGGTEWTRLSNNKSFGVSSIQVDTTNNIIYIGTYVYANGLLRNGLYGYGIMKSSDNGETWNTIYNNAEERTDISVLLFSEASGKIYSIDGDYFIQSSDQGQTWTSTYVAEGIDIRSFSQNPVNPDQLVISGPKSIFTTNNGGLDWDLTLYNRILTVVPDPDWLWLAADYSNSGTLWINATRKSTKYYSDILKSHNNGQLLLPTSVVNTNIGSTTGAVVILKAFSDDCIYAGGGSLDKITNDGTEREDATSYNGSNTHADIRDICFPVASDPDLTYIVTDGGVNITTTGGVNLEYPGSGSMDEEWKRIYGNLALNDCYTIAISEQDPELMIIGTHDNGTYKRYNDGTWKHVRGGDGGSTLIGSHNYNTMFSHHNYPLQQSKNAGENWSTCHDEFTVNVNNFSSGIYFFIIYKNKQIIYNNKFIVKH